MTINKKVKLLVIVAVCLVMTTAAFGGIKERMKARLPVIAALKAKGVIGESNRGYLGYVTDVRESEDVIAAENKDRKAIYSYFAQQQNTSLEVVEKVQAQRKAEKAIAGEYIQSGDGAWIKKTE